MRVVSLAWAGVCLLIATMALAQPAPRTWQPDCIHHADLWADRMNDAIVSAGPEGLRVEIAPDRKWGIAAVPNVALPANVSTIRVKVRELGGGGKWLMRLYGDIRGTGSPNTFGPFQDMAAAGLSTLELDPRALRLVGTPPIQVQLGLEGPPGAYVVFESAELLPSSRRVAPPTIPGQRNVECVDLMPNLPQPYKMKDWRAVAQGYDRLAFDFSAKGQYLPLIWLDDSHVNIDGPAFGIPSYVGAKQSGNDHEGITTMGAVLGATLVGVDKTKQEHDYVAMCEAYYNKRNGQNLVLNRMDTGTGGSFWYELFPHIVWYALADRYPGHAHLDAIMRTTADRWRECCYLMPGNDGKPDFGHTSFDFAKMKPVDNGQWKEPDAAAAIAWLQYMAWARYGDAKYLQAADVCLQYLHERRSNPYYENLLPWGTCVAARMNAELGREYDVEKLLNWCFGISDTRGGWGVVVGNWGGYDIDGLLGSVDNRGGYAFAMNTFTQAAALTPLVRYDVRYARAIGKWMLNLANSARLFYPPELPPDHQSSAFWKGDPAGVIAYEGLRYEWNGKRPYATGDPVVMKWGPETDLGLYGSGYVGLLGSIVGRTNDERILALDCLATDFFHARAYPTLLVYNPYPQGKTVTFAVGKAPVDLFDAVTGQFLARNQRGQGRFTLMGDHAAVVVLAPAGAKLTTDGHKTRIGGVVVRYALPGMAGY